MADDDLPKPLASVAGVSAQRTTMAERLLAAPTLGRFPDGDGVDMATQFVAFPRTVCQCGRPECEDGPGPMAMWRGQNGEARTFLGLVQLPSGAFRKLDDPRDLYSEGHCMSVLELMTEFNHCDGGGRSTLDSFRARDLGPYLVDFRGHPPPQDKDDGTDYPFYDVLESPYNNSSPPKVRAGDVVKVVTESDLEISEDLKVPPGEDVHIYVISLTSAGMLTGVLESDRTQYMVYFSVHHVRKLVTRGENWLPETERRAGDSGEKCCNCQKGIDSGWYNCPNNKTTRGGEDHCVSRPRFKFCEDCGPDYVKGKRRELWRDEGGAATAASDTEHQRDMMMMYCGGFDRGSCMATGSVREPLVECRACATSGERKLRSCFSCGKIRCISCIAFAAEQGGSMMGVNDSAWNMLGDLMPGGGMDDMIKSAFVDDCIKRCGDCGRDVCMQCVSEGTLASNLSKGHLFDCKDSGCRCVSCMTQERIEGKCNEGDTAFKCDDCRRASKTCHNPECANPSSKTCTRCGAAKYCSKDCQVKMWPSHKAECKKMARKKNVDEGDTMKRSEAKGKIRDVMSAHKKSW